MPDGLKVFHLSMGRSLREHIFEIVGVAINSLLTGAKILRELYCQAMSLD